VALGVALGTAAGRGAHQREIATVRGGVAHPRVEQRELGAVAAAFGDGARAGEVCDAAVDRQHRGGNRPAVELGEKEVAIRRAGIDACHVQHEVTGHRAPTRARGLRPHVHFAGANHTDVKVRLKPDTTYVGGITYVGSVTVGGGVIAVPTRYVVSGFSRTE
jgi:hypothetical protein